MSSLDRDDIARLMPIFQAFLEGKAQWKWSASGDDMWDDCVGSQDFGRSGMEWRVKPPATRRVPWTMADVPPVCWLSCRPGGAARLVISISDTDVRIATASIGYTYANLLQDGWLYSSDLKSWKPTGTEEAL